MVVATGGSRASLELARNVFTEPELWRLMWVEATLAAEPCLVPMDELCREHRRLAFGLWLRLSGRVSDGVAS